jgi:ABC-2 type transport system ATP-binding protein
VANVAVLECLHLTKWYGELVAVNDFSVEVQPGITGFLGPNGAGKSTLMRLAMGLAQPSSGSISVLGEDPWDNPGLLKRIGYVPEGKAPYRDLTGRKCATRLAHYSGLEGSAADEAVERALAKVGLAHVADKPVKTYSRGTEQRLKIALALMHEPDLYILDEPLLGTDPLARHDLIEVMRGLAKDGKSVIVSTHVLPDVEAMTQRILLMNHGRLVAHGDVGQIRDLLERYPRTVRIATSDPRALGRALWGWDEILSLESEEGAVVVKTRTPQPFYERLQKLLVKEGIPFTAVTSPDDSVEAVFRYLVGYQ